MEFLYDVRVCHLLLHSVEIEGQVAGFLSILCSLANMCDGPSFESYHSCDTRACLFSHFTISLEATYNNQFLLSNTCMYLT
jgi:hypothetical protein